MKRNWAPVAQFLQMTMMQGMPSSKKTEQTGSSPMYSQELKTLARLRL